MGSVYIYSGNYRPHTSNSFSCGLAAHIFQAEWMPRQKYAALLTLYVLNFVSKYMYFCIFSLRKHRWSTTFLMEDKDTCKLRSQLHCCSCPGDARSQDISSNGIELVLQEYSRTSTRRLTYQGDLYNFLIKYLPVVFKFLRKNTLYIFIEMSPKCICWEPTDNETHVWKIISPCFHPRMHVNLTNMPSPKDYIC